MSCQHSEISSELEATGMPFYISESNNFTVASTLLHEPYVRLTYLIRNSLSFNVEVSSRLRELDISVGDIGISAQTKISIRPEPLSLRCTKYIHQEFIVRNGCPGSRRLVHTTPDNELYSLPVNYRPPSKMGVDIPVTEKIYNANPLLPRYRDYYSISKETGVNVKCSSSVCNCSAAHEDLTDDNTECIRHAFRLLYSEPFNPQFLVLGDSSDVKYTLREVNNRTDYCPSSVSDCNSIQLIRNAVYDQNTTIAWSGSELYHFEALVVNDRYCTLTDYMTVFVLESSPRTSILASTMALTGVGFSLWLFGLYFGMQIRN